MQRSDRSPAMLPVPALPAPAAGLPAATLLCAVSLVASARPMQMKLPKLPNFDVPKLPNVGLPKLPNVDLPKLPDLDLPNFGKKAKSQPKQPVATRRAVPAGVTVKVRPASSAVPKDAPTLAELTGQDTADTIPQGDGWRRFPLRRMPGANMQRWKEIAKELTPKP